MRYLLLHHESETDLAARPAEEIESAVAFAARFEDELAARSELEWGEVLGSDEAAVVVSPGGTVEPAGIGSGSVPGSVSGSASGSGSAPLLRRAWAIRVDDEARARELAADLADGIAARIELRECLSGSQRP